MGTVKNVAKFKEKNGTVELPGVDKSTIMPKDVTSNITRIDKTIDEMLKPLEVLTEEQASVITQLTSNNESLTETLNNVYKTNNDLVASNMSVSNTMERLKDDLDEQVKITELQKIELRMTNVYASIVTIVAIIEAVYFFVIQ